MASNDHNNLGENPQNNLNHSVQGRMPEKMEAKMLFEKSKKYQDIMKDNQRQVANDLGTAKRESFLNDQKFTTIQQPVTRAFVEMKDKTGDGDKDQNDFSFRKNWYATMVIFLILSIKICMEWIKKSLSYAFGFSVPKGFPEDQVAKFEIGATFPELNQYYGFLSGMVYYIPYMAAGLLTGSFTSMVNRKVALGLTIILGGISQSIAGSINSFQLLCGMRVMNGAVSAATNPLSYSLVADYVPPQKRATANSIIGASRYLGVSLSSLSILLIRSKGWRFAYKFMGTVAILIGISFIMLVREPKRGRFETSEPTNQPKETREKLSPQQILTESFETLLIVMRQPTSRYVVLATMMRTLAGISASAFAPIYFLKVFPAYRDQYAVWNAASLAFGGIISSLVGGIISDAFESKNLMSKAYVCIYSSFLAFPLIALSTSIQGSFWFSMIMISLKSFMSAGYTSPAITMMQNTTDSKNQGRIISAYVFYTTIMSILCPAVFSKMAFSLGAAKNPAIYGYLLTIFSFIGYWGSIPLWWLAGKNYKKHMTMREKS